MDELRFEEVVSAGGVVVFGADTVYGLACDAMNPAAVERLYALKRRPPEKPAAVMVFSVEHALSLVGPLGPRTQAALTRLLPGAVTVLLENPRGLFPLACGPDPSTLGLRVPDLPALASVTTPLLQSSANVSSGPDPLSLDEVPASIREGADLVLDRGELPGKPSTVIDLRAYEASGEWSVVREGAVAADQLRL